MQIKIRRALTVVATLAGVAACASPGPAPVEPRTRPVPQAQRVPVVPTPVPAPVVPATPPVATAPVGPTIQSVAGATIERRVAHV